LSSKVPSSDRQNEFVEFDKQFTKGNVVFSREQATKSLKVTPLFECCYVRDDICTYEICKSGSETTLFYRSVNRNTNVVESEGVDPAFNKEHSDLVVAIGNHYNPRYIVEEAISQENLDYDEEYMHYHTVFGQSVYFGDVTGLRYIDEEGLESSI